MSSRIKGLKDVFCVCVCFFFSSSLSVLSSIDIVNIFFQVNSTWNTLSWSQVGYQVCLRLYALGFISNRKSEFSLSIA